MIEWFPLFFNALWVTGLAILFANASFQSYRRSLKEVTTQETAAQSRYPWAEAAGLLLFCLDLLFTADSLLERVAWAVMALACILWPFWAPISARWAGRK